MAPPWHDPPDPYLLRLATALADLERLRVRLANILRRLENP